MRATTLVRSIMQRHGKRMIFTNNYPLCHTVKCYAKFDRNEDAALEKAIAKVLTARKIPFKFKSGYGGGFIVRIPKEVVRVPEHTELRAWETDSYF